VSTEPFNNLWDERDSSNAASRLWLYKYEVVLYALQRLRYACPAAFQINVFEPKKPNLSGSLKQCFGDNIYSRDADAQWQQLDSHHSFQDGSPNVENLATDTGTNRVLLSTQFAYFGADAPVLPHDLQSRGPGGICAGRHHRVNFEPGVEIAFLNWFEGLFVTGQNGTPFEWLKNGALRK
jgi:hypothetical protein